MGRKLLLTLSSDPRRAPEKQTLGTVKESRKMLTLQALSSSLNAGASKRGCLGQGEAFGCFRQSVPQNGRVHLLGIDLRFDGENSFTIFRGARQNSHSHCVPASHLLEGH